jgi:hypothetical protein
MRVHSVRRASNPPTESIRRVPRSRWVSLGLAILLALGLIGFAALAAGCGEEAPAAGPAAGKTLIIYTQKIVTQGAYETKTKVGDIDQWRDAVWVFDQVASDNRLSGRWETAFSVDQRADLSADMWGTFTLTNEGGTWEGEWTGMIAKGGTTHYMLTDATGTGDYKGLEYHSQAHFVEEAGKGFQSGTEVIGNGWIAKSE